MTWGRLVFLALLIALVYWAPQWMPQGADESASEAGEARSSASPKAERLLRDAEHNRGSLKPEQRALLDELQSARGGVSKSKVREKLLKTLEQETHTLSFIEWAADSWLAAQKLYQRIQPEAQSWLWTLAFVMVAMGLAAALVPQMRLARLSARTGFSLSRAWLVILSLLAIALALVTRTNPWPSFPSELVFPPMVALMGCALALRVVDLNYPVWNSLVRGCGAPLISMGFIAAFLKLV